MKNFLSSFTASATSLLASCIALLAISSPSNAQAQDRAQQSLKPAAITHALAPLSNVARTTLPPLNFLEIQQQDEKDFAEGLAPRYAVPNEVRITPHDAGTWEPLDAATSVWRLLIECPNALHINLGFTRYVMPEGGVLFVYNPNLTDIVRPFTARDVASHGELWTPPVAGDKIVVEVTIPNQLVDQLQLTLGFINAGYRKFGPLGDPPGGVDSGSCNLDVACPEADPWRLQIPAVAVISTGGSRFCTGFMVNNVRQDRKPYFMTANHCGINAGNAASLVVFWNFENSTCRPVGSPQSGGAGDGSLSQFSTGSIFRASFSTSDFTLVELSQSPDPAWQLSWAGWDRSDVYPSVQNPAFPGNSIGVCIHHPNTDEKRITYYGGTGSTHPPHGSSWGCSAFPGPGDQTHVKVYWTPGLGVTEPGSSGSPLFDGNKRVIGQLHGGASACGATGENLSDCYGRIARSWEGGGTSSTQLKAWLDPDNTGAMFVDTIGPGLSVSPSSNVTHVGLVGGPFSNNPTVYSITNTTGSAANYAVSVVSGGTLPVLLNGGTGPISGSIGSGGAGVNISVSLGAGVSSLPAGVYASTVLFQDTTNGIQYARVHTLEVGQVGFTVAPATALNASGPVGGPFNGVQAYTVTSVSQTPATVRVAADQSWISLNGSGSGGFVDVSLPAQGSSVNVTVGISAAAGGLAAGAYTGAVSFTNVTGSGTGTASDTVRPVNLEVGSFVYNSTGGVLSIPDASGAGVSSTINVADGYCVGDVNVTLNVTHTYVGDLKFVLTHNGLPVTLINRPTAGGGSCSSDNYVNVVLDDEGSGGAIQGICTANLTSPPGYVPNAPLSGFDNGNVAGSWTLTVSDHAGQDVGTLNSWSLKILPLPTACPPVANDVTVNVPVVVMSNIVLSGTASGGGPLNYVVMSLPSHGMLFDPNGGAIGSAPYTLLNQGNVVRYKPDAAYAGNDVFTYKVNNGLDSNVATVNVTVGGPQLAFSFNMDANPGWALTGQWAWGQPAGLGGDPASGFTGANVLGYNLNGAYVNNMPEYTATSTAINCSNLTGVLVKFRRWLGVEQATFDHARFQVSNNGTTWTTIWENPAGTGQTITESSWSLQSYNISAIADNKATVYLRWTMGPTDSSVVYSGWNLDDIEVWGIRPPCPADVTHDNVVNVSDLLAIVNAWGACQACAADINQDGQVNVSDLLAVVNGWGGCP